MPRVLILRAPGTNCDKETAFAFEQAGAEAELLHVNRLLENPGLLAKFQILCLPGGFSYGDDLAAGRILASQLRHHLAEALAEFTAGDKLVLGICNGFQVLIQTGLLLARENGEPAATLTNNDSGKFEDRWVQLQVQGNKCVFLAGLEDLYLPVAHAEGKFVARSAELLETLRSSGQLVLKYSPLSESSAVEYPANPNGSQGDVAGVCDPSGRIFGLMPHPERFIDRVQHPRWTRTHLPEQGAGLAVFQNAVRYFA